MEGWFSDVEVNEDDFLTIDDGTVRKVGDRCGLEVFCFIRSDKNGLVWVLWVGIVDVGKKGVIWLKLSDCVSDELSGSSSMGFLVSLVEVLVLIELTDDGKIWEVVFDIALRGELVSDNLNDKGSDDAHH